MDPKAQNFLFPIDNSAVVQALNTVTSKSTRVMYVIRKVVLLLLQYTIQLRTIYMNTKANRIVDA